MPALISGSLVIAVWFYVLLISRWHLFWNVPFVQPLKNAMEGRLALSHGIAIGAALLALVIAAVTMFRVREQSMVVGSKKTLFAFALLAGAAVVVLAVKLVKLELPYIEAYLVHLQG